MKNIVSIFILLLVILFFSSHVSSLALSRSIYNFNYDELNGLNEDVTFVLKSRSQETILVEIEFKKELSDYVSATINNFTLEPGQIREVTINLNLPSGLDKVGSNEAWILFTKRDLDYTGSGFMTVTTAVAGRVIVTFAYPGEYILITDLSPVNVNQGENTVINWEVQARGMNTTNFVADLKIMDEDEILFSEIFPSRSLERNERHKTITQINSDNFSPGKYDVILEVTSGDNTDNRSEILRIGEEDFDLISFDPKNFSIGEIVEFSFVVENLWNGKFSNVYAIIEFDDVSSITRSVNVDAFAQVTFDKQYIDLREFEEGTYEGSLTLFFEGNSKSFDIEIEAINQKNSMNKLWLIGLVVVLLIAGFFIVFLFYKSNKKNMS